MKVMICCRSRQADGTTPEAVISMLRHCILANACPRRWTLSTFGSTEGTGLYLLVGSSVTAANSLADAIRECDIGLDVDVWQPLDSCDVVTALFP